jgi:transcriptional regulator with GAF, ATPase, and Fis domain
MRLHQFSQRIQPPDLPEALRDESCELVGSCDAMRYVRFRLEQVAPTETTVLLLGEPGTGRGLAAHLAHRLSRRREARFITVDCESLPNALIECELFGGEPGAFPDARTARIGRFHAADKGTIFLDEVAGLPPEAQAKLLRVLQHGEFEPVGSAQSIVVDVRVIAATRRNLPEEVRAGRFRRDLYYRLSVFPIQIPPLRARGGDIVVLARHLIERLSARHRKRIDCVPESVWQQIAASTWSGNVRELENVLERAIIATPDTTLRLFEPSSAEMPAGRPETPPSSRMRKLDIQRSTPDAAQMGPRAVA